MKHLKNAGKWSATVRLLGTAGAEQRRRYRREYVTTYYKCKI